MGCCKPSTVVVEAKNGSPTLKVADEQGNMVFLHSSYNPEAEALNAVQGFNPPADNLIVVLGFGLGYHIEALLEKNLSKTKILVIERWPDVFQKAVEVRDMSAILKNEQVSIILGKDFSAISRQFQKDFYIIRETGISFFEHLASIRLNSQFYKEVTTVLKDEVSLQLSILATRISFKDQWIKNNLINLKDVMKSPGVLSLANKMTNLPGIVISAGPSLNKNIHFLKQAKERAVLICVGTALRTVLKAGIKPDLVVTFDASEKNYQHFEGLNYDDIPLVFDPMAYPEIVKQHHGQKYIASVGSNITTWLEKSIGPKGILPAGGSVATLALSLAVAMGCNPIALVGQDLSFLDGRTHARGTIYEDDKIDNNNTDLHQFYVPANDGGQVLTQRNFYSFIIWFERFIKTLPAEKRIVNATEGGARIEGTLIMTLSDYINTYCERDISLELGGLSSKATNAHPDTQKLTRELAGVLKILNIIRKKSAKGVDLADQLYDYYLKNHLFNEDKLFRQLNSIDQTIKANQKEVTFIDETMQELLLRVTKGPLANKCEDETVDQTKLRVAKLTKVLYEGIHKSVCSFYNYFDEALKTVNLETNNEKGEKVNDR